ncbi:MAG TPA: ATP-binding protein [Gaiellaceae bacterium]|jgi:signal transduction histidine kinase|nr:ATP-binding protein [Gaiellaceae bacterium]
MSRLPIRVRLSLAFAAAMAVLLAALGAFLYFQLRHSLDEQIEASLRAQADAAAAGAVVQREESLAQVLDADGEVTRGFDRPLAEPATRERFVDRDVAGLDDNPYRLLVVPGEGGQTIVVGASLEDRDDALGGLLAAFLVGGPIALALSTLLGYLLAGALLRPVEDMRRRAAEISTERAGQKLPLPHAHDEIFRLGSTLNEMLGRLEAGIARERRFVADASHELRTPLALLRTELELAQRRPRSPEELRAALDSAAEEVDRLTRLAEDLLVLARADEGRLQLRREEIQVKDLLETVAARSNQDVEIGVRDGESIIGDRLRLEQALGNLVDNARRHGAGTIRLEAERKNDLLELRVSDEGPGFAPELLPHAFDRFTRGDEARERGGTGLGLAIVAAVAKAHGGRAHAAGSTVTIELPG